MEISKLIVKMQFGSHVSGTNLPSSDTDHKAVHLPTADEILLQRVKNTVVTKTKQDESQRNSAEDIDFESFSLQRYMQLLLEGQTVALDMLFTPDKWLLESSNIWDEIQANKERWLSSGITSFVGYCRQQASKYGIRGSRVAATRESLELLDDLIARHDPLSKLGEHWAEVEAFAAGREHVAIIESAHRDGRAVQLFEVCNRKVQEHVTLKEARKVFQLILDRYGQRALQAERNEGVDWKALCHAVRICGEAQELLRNHTITFPRPEAALLLKIRKGEMPYSEVAEIIESGMAELENAKESSTLPMEPDRARADELIMSVYSNEI